MAERESGTAAGGGDGLREGAGVLVYLETSFLWQEASIHVSKLEGKIEKKLHRSTAPLSKSKNKIKYRRNPKKQTNISLLEQC